MATLTKHNNLKIASLNESADIREVVKNFEVIDDGLCKFYVATLKSANIYRVETGTDKTSLADGYGLTIAIPSKSTGAVKINVDNFTAPLVGSDGNPVSNLKQNGIYTLRYYKGNFILASGENVDYGSTSVGTDGTNVLENVTFIGSDGEQHKGTMKNHGTVTKQLALNETFTIGSGHVDSVKITQNILTRNAYTEVVGYEISGDKLNTKIPQGAYFSNSDSGYPIIESPLSKVYDVLGLTPDKIAGNIPGMSGTALRFFSGTASVSWKDLDGFTQAVCADLSACPFVPKLIYLHTRGDNVIRHMSAGAFTTSKGGCMYFNFDNFKVNRVFYEGDNIRASEKFPTDLTKVVLAYAGGTINDPVIYGDPYVEFFCIG